MLFILINKSWHITILFTLTCLFSLHSFIHSLNVNANRNDKGKEVFLKKTKRIKHVPKIIDVKFRKISQ